jgi:ribulose-phosphate 3-epimerase
MIGAMGWDRWARGGREIEPSLYAADFSRLGEQISQLLDAGARVFHFDVGDGHFVPPVTIGPVVLRSIARLVHERGGVLDCHLMVDDPIHHIPEIAESGGDSITFHVEAAEDPERVIAIAREHGLGVGVSCKPETPVPVLAAAARGADLALLMSIEPGYSGQAFMPEALARIADLAPRVDCPVQVDGGIKHDNARAVLDAGARLLVVGSGIFGYEDLPRAYRRLDALLR